jgi:hypothetical protein
MDDRIAFTKGWDAARAALAQPFATCDCAPEDEAFCRAQQSITHPIGQVSSAIDEHLNVIAKMAEVHACGVTQNVLQKVRAALAAHPAPVCHAPAGWKLVPIEPTDEMRLACQWLDYSDHIDADWARMLDAAPAAPISAISPSDATGKADDASAGGLSGAHHLTPENVVALIADMKACEAGGEVPSIFDRDWRTQCGVIWRVMEHLAGATSAADAMDAQRLDFMDGHAFVSLHQCISDGHLFIEVECEPEGKFRGETVRAAIDSAMAASRNVEGA